MRNLIQDIRFSLRQFLKRPGFTLTAILILAMGGTIAAGNRRDGPGAVFTIALPVPAQVERAVETAGR